MDRRRFLVTSLVGALAAPLAAEAQQAGRLYKIGYLGGSSAVSVRPGMAALRQYLQELGWVDGRNLAIEMRMADGKGDRLPTLAGELVALGVDVIVTQGSPATRAAKQVTTAVPIVMWNTTDPVGQGFVASLAILSTRRWRRSVRSKLPARRARMQHRLRCADPLRAFPPGQDRLSSHNSRPYR